MNRFMIVPVLFSLISCSSSVIQNSVQYVQTGWLDEDTYMVKVTGSDENAAIDRAKHQILKDIVDVRMRNNSRYTDIEKIRDEFKQPLQNGIIIQRNTVPDGLQIYFQIHDKGLRLKFQRI